MEYRACLRHNVYNISGWGCGKPLPYFRPDTIFHTVFQTCRRRMQKCRGVFREGGRGGGLPPPPPPFIWVWDFLGQYLKMVHEPLQTYGFQTKKRLQKHCICKTSTCISRDLRDPDFKIFPRVGVQSLCKPRNLNFSSPRIQFGAELTVPER